MTPQEVRALLISLHAVRRCWGGRRDQPIQQFNLGQFNCGDCRAQQAEYSRERRRLQRKYRRAA